MKTVTLDFLLRVMDVLAKIDSTDAIWWRTDGEYAPVTIFVNCSDLFWWAHADVEEVTPRQRGRA